VIEEIPLPGGDLNPIVRVGDTVRRPQGPWSPAVHALLEHYERAGFDGAPRFLGVDEQGREILTYIEGEAALPPVPGHDEVLPALGRLLRRMHDAQEGFVPPPGAEWQLPPTPPSGDELVCHHDLFWPNVIFRDGLPVTLIDWDLAAPASRVHDVASAVNYWAPLRPDEQSGEWGVPVDRRGERMLALVDAYGLDEPGRAALLDVVAERVAIWIEAYRIWGRDERRPGWAELWDRVGDRYLVAKQRWFEQHRAELEAYLR
jgi:Ser/Thr protein kinase RdoA (MazF antagonist)